MNLPRVLRLLLVLLPLSGRSLAQRAPTGRVSDTTLNASLRQALARPGANLEFRWVIAGSATHDSSAREVFDADSREWLRLDTLWLNEDGLQKVGATFSGGQAYVFATLKPEVTRRLQADMARHQKQRLAVFINGSFVRATIIVAPSASPLPVAMGADSTLGASLVERLQARILAK